ncbi:glycoside hydrolase family 38 C-terminal domain-containing protein [Nonomuraea sp. NPDC059194]|uniref:glycoside hydrolase family 38 N-terminal domain-containing protein n=1 Tax=Nonomuraea sp. NPDC059194 TaxID=3346764 RepID=UPI0036B267F2
MRVTQEIVVVPHTHWDREWYEPFQRFRLRLVALMDEVLDTMEREPGYHFTLDGQLACVDDYLEVRPDNRDRIAALVEAGRLAIGPWQILLDEFLCSGETIVRNLELGMGRADKLGGAMPVGYLPDMFGHTAQMPQILALAGLTRACVYRGVPSSVVTDAFAWVAPDGTAVRTQYLPAGGYGNGAHLFEAPGQLVERAEKFVTTMRSWQGESKPLLAMYGTDHSAPVRGLPEMVASLGARMDTLSGYLGASDVEGLPRVHGELRSHAGANILPGVISVRAHVKQAMGRAERMVERYAEPLAALWGESWPERFLDMAWWRLVDASGHDSVTGCGVDETAQQVAARIAEAEHLGQAVRDMVASRLAAAVPSGGVLVVNPSPFPRTGVVLMDVAGHDPLVDAAGRAVPVQTLEYAPTLLLDEEMDPTLAFSFVHGTELYGQQITGWSIADGVLIFRVARESAATFDVAEVSAALEAAEGEVTRVRIVAEPRRTVAALVETPALGHTSVRPQPPFSPETPATSFGTVSAEVAGKTSADGRSSLGRGVRAEGRVLDNGLLRVEIAEDGTLTLTGRDGVTITGAARVVDGGDVGDTYNHAPPATDRLVDEPESVEVGLVCSGPLVAALDVERVYAWPRGTDVSEADGPADPLPDPARTEAVERVTVITRVELRAGEPYVRLHVEFDNRCADHRVRLHVPLAEAAGSSFAEGQFAVVERGLTAEGGCGETPLPTFPASSWVAAGGVAALLEHVTEYELVDDELALTLLRSVGYLSRNRNALRPEPAGPQLPTPAAQSRGPRSVRLALMPYTGTWAAVPEAAEVFRHDVLAVPGTGDKDLPQPAPATGLSVRGEGVVMTSLRRRDGWKELRMVAMTGSDTVATIEGEFTEARRADLRGRPGEPVDAARLPLRAWEIATIQLR